MKFEQALALINNQLGKEQFNKEPLGLYEPVTYTMANGGKRIRPALTLMAYSVFSDCNVEAALMPALGVEILHNFTLLHDDIMDHAEVRRGKPTVHEKWNENTAILSGDAMFILAYQYLAKCDEKVLPQVLNVFSKTALEICEGQQYDMDFEARNNVQIPEYLEMIRLKTAVLLGCSLKIGAICAGASDKDADLLYEFGINIGLAFQLMDDILDVYADYETFGKEPGGDIASNKKTFMLLKALEIADEEKRKSLDKWIGKTKFDKNEKYLAVKSVYDQLNIRELATQLMDRYYNLALDNISNLSQKNKSVNDILDLARYLMKRTK